jgi:hypothetical protein
MKYPVEVYKASARQYRGIPELSYPFHDRTALVTCCGRICIFRKKINLSTSLAGQAVGIKEVDEGIWLVSFMAVDAVVRELFPHEFPANREKYRECLSCDPTFLG